jgi:hypothetical protein
MQTSGIRTGNLILAKRGDLLLYAKCLDLYPRLRRKAFGRSDDGIAAWYRGIGWCDSTEHQLSNGIMTSSRNRL